MGSTHLGSARAVGASLPANLLNLVLQALQGPLATCSN